MKGHGVILGRVELTMVLRRNAPPENKYIDERAWRLKLSLYTVSAFSFPNEHR